MSELQALRLYLAVKLHFQDKKYDVFQNKGRVANVNETTLHSNRTRRAMLNRVLKHHSNPQEMVQFFVAQYAYADNSAIYDPMASEENFAEWVRRKPSITYQTSQLLEDYPFSELVSEDPPKIFKLIIQDQAWIESAVALNVVSPFLKEHYFAFNELGVKIRKLAGFVKFNNQQIANGMENETSINF